ncbi:hypothetical protein [Rhodococcus sp. NPDC060176]|uniref:hypothetical protein n=1 Tax=Rhodococcus sp. NPDC060176 TaxID=3347062 RepID=UPI0036610561
MRSSPIPVTSIPQRNGSADSHPNGHTALPRPPVMLHALPDYDALIGVDFDSTPTTVMTTP